MAIDPQPGSEFLPPEPNPPRPWWVVALRGIVALVILGGLLWFSGLYQQTFVRRTADTARPFITTTPVAATTIVVPLNVFVITNTEGEGSSRTPADSVHLVDRAAEIWEQAGITFSVATTDIQEVALSADDIRRLNHSPREIVPTLPGWNRDVLTAVLVRAIPEGVNGFAMSDINTTLVADFTSVFDWRTLAHEIGHLLTLEHVDDPQQLMFSGSNGLLFSETEVVRSRQAANSLSR